MELEPCFDRSLSPAVRATIAIAIAGAISFPAAADSSLPSVASINLCADQLVLTLARPRADSHRELALRRSRRSRCSPQKRRAIRLNYGSAEELLRFDPDVVIAGAYTNAFTRALLARLGYKVVELEPETTIAEIEANLRRVATRDRPHRARRAARRGDSRGLAAARRGPRRGARSRPSSCDPGGFTVGDHSLAHDLMTLAGLRNVAAEQGLDRWGSLSMETLLRSAPDLIVLTGYRASQPSLANAVLAHPALRARARHAPLGHRARRRIGRAACRRASSPPTCCSSAAAR